MRKKFETSGTDYSIPQLDLSAMPAETDRKFSELYTLSTVADNGKYLGHPDSILLKNGDILTFYPSGHGKGALRCARSTDGGRTYTDDSAGLPDSWKNSRETPTVYRLNFSDSRADKLVLISGNPRWGTEPTTGGFNVSFSDDEGETWSEFELVYPKKYKPIVAMASLTRLKENGIFVDRWMALFHDSRFHNYKTVLSFGSDGKPLWSKPEKYFAQYREIEKGSQMCEVECIRSDCGEGDELCLLTRSNTKKMNSLVSFSTDEGITWSEPRELPAALNGERHKADYLPDGRLFITFRSVQRSPEKAALSSRKDGWCSEGWVAWVGTYDDIRSGRQGQYRIKLAHTYHNGQQSPCADVDADTGYCGNVVLTDGTVVTSTYGKFSPQAIDRNGQSVPGTEKTYVISKRIDPKLTDELVSLKK